MLVAYPIEPATWKGSPGLKPGAKWTLSVWARAPAATHDSLGPTLRFGAPYYYFYSWQATEGSLDGRKPCEPPRCYVKDVVLTGSWEKYELPVTSPDPLWHSSGTSWIFVEVLTAGVALIDLIELVPAE